MMHPEPPSADATARETRIFALEDTISTVLRVGVWSSLALLVLGGLLGFLEPGGYGVTAGDMRRLTGPEAGFPRTLSWLLDGLAHLQGQAIIVAGLLLLIATPIIRVAISIGLFAAQKDRVYVLLTAAVLALLLLSFALGKAG
jgi:uncharacterized membrane protein